MKSERMVSLMLLLQARSPRSARELSLALEVSQRTIYRDVDALSASGVPVYAERGSGGGIALSDGYRQAIAQFSTDELNALFLAAADPLAELGVTAHRQALDKIAGALPDLQRRAANKARQRILLDHNRWYRSEQPAALLSVLRRAVWDDRQVRISYKDRTGTPTERIADPIGLVSKAGIWYLIARQEGGEMRTFRVDRMIAAEELRTQFARDDDFDLEAHWRSSKAALERPMEWYYATLYVRAESIERIMSYGEVELLSSDQGGRTIRMRFPAFSVAVESIAGWGAASRAIDPPELREALAVRARELLALYETAEVGNSPA